MPGFQSTRLVTEGALEPFFFLYTDDSIQGNPETCKQSSIMLNYEVKNSYFERKYINFYYNYYACFIYDNKSRFYRWIFYINHKSALWIFFFKKSFIY